MVTIKITTVKGLFKIVAILLTKNEELHFFFLNFEVRNLIQDRWQITNKALA